MNVIIIVGHPNSKSFNHALAGTCKSQLEENGHIVVFRDLYVEQFDAVDGISNNTNGNDIGQYRSELVNSDGIIVIHPNWWGQPPAIIKGWLDRVFIPEVAYSICKDDNGNYAPKGLLKATAAIILNTSNTPDELEEKIYKDPLETIWKNRVFNFCGVSDFTRRNFQVIKDSDLQQRTIWLTEVKELINKKFPKK